MKAFEAESARILDLMINSIYTHKEIFLRELISNASDAIDKLYYRSLSENISGLAREDFRILVTLDKENRTINIDDNGCGMSEQELERNLGIIAKSGSLEFKSQEKTEHDEKIDIIGQFGVGFYSSFMVADKVTVLTKAYGSDEAFLWESTGAEGYEISKAEKESYGTSITLHIKENDEDNNYDDFLSDYYIEDLIKKHSDYIRYPIKKECEKSEPVEGKDEWETKREIVTLNSMVPLWKKNKSEITEEDYNNFYLEHYYDFTPPLKHIHMSTEGVVSYNALLFIPTKASPDMYTKEHKSGLSLYSSGVLIMESCADLIPEYFGFVKGLVDSADISLNISREMTQHDAVLAKISNRLEKKVHDELLSMLKNNRDDYLKFYDEFKMSIKVGIYERFGANKDKLIDLVMFNSSFEDSLVTLDEYASRAKDEFIYYVAVDSIERAKNLAQTESFLENGTEILYLTDDIDEFCIKMIDEFNGKKFKSILDKDTSLSEEDKKQIEQKAEDNKDLLSFMQDTLKDSVKEVIISNKLKNHAVALSVVGAISSQMEKILNQMPNSQKVHADRVLEINDNHEIFSKLKVLYETDKDKLADYTKILYYNAVLSEGGQIDDIASYNSLVLKLMSN